MKILDLYTLEELREGLGEKDYLFSRSNYNKYHSAYKFGLCNDQNFSEWSKGAIDYRRKTFIEPSLDRELMVIHILEIPLQDVPLYINSQIPGVIRACEFRMENGR